MLGGTQTAFAQKGNACRVGGGDDVLGVNESVEDRCIHGFQIRRELRHVNGSWGTAAATSEGPPDAAGPGGAPQLPPAGFLTCPPSPSCSPGPFPVSAPPVPSPATKAVTSSSSSRISSAVPL